MCEWALALGLDASPFFDYEITGQLLVTLSDGDLQGLLGLDEAQISRVGHALRDVRAGAPSAGRFPSVSRPTSALPSVGLPPLRQPAIEQAPSDARPRGDASALSAATLATMSDGELEAAFGLTPAEVRALREKPKPMTAASAGISHLFSPQVPDPVASSAPASANPSWLHAAEPQPAPVSSPVKEAPARKAATSSLLFGDGDEEEAQRTAPAPFAQQHPTKPKAASLFADEEDEEDSLFKPRSKAVPAAAQPPPPAKALLFQDLSDEDEVPAAQSLPVEHAAPAVEEPTIVFASSDASPSKTRVARSVLAVGACIGQTEEDEREEARFTATNAAFRAEAVAQLEELQDSGEVERETRQFDDSFSALEQKLAALEAAAAPSSHATKLEPPAPAAAPAPLPTTSFLFADDVQDEAVQRAESLLSSLHLFKVGPDATAGDPNAAPAPPTARRAALFDSDEEGEPAGPTLAPATAPLPAQAAPKASLFDDTDDEEESLFKPQAAPASAMLVAKQRSALFSDSDDEDPAAAAPEPAAPQPAAAAQSTFEDLLQPAAPVEELPQEQPAVWQPEPTVSDAGSKDVQDDAAHSLAPLAAATSGAVLSEEEDKLALPSPTPLREAECPPAHAPPLEEAPAAAEQHPIVEAAAAREPAASEPPARPGGRVATLAAALSASNAPPPMPARAPTGIAVPPQRPVEQLAPALPAKLPSTPLVVESLATAGPAEVKRPAPPARGPRRLTPRNPAE